MLAQNVSTWTTLPYWLDALPGTARLRSRRMRPAIGWRICLKRDGVKELSASGKVKHRASRISRPAVSNSRGPRLVSDQSWTATGTANRRSSSPLWSEVSLAGQQDAPKVLPEPRANPDGHLAAPGRGLPDRRRGVGGVRRSGRGATGRTRPHPAGRSGSRRTLAHAGGRRGRPRSPE